MCYVLGPVPLNEHSASTGIAKKLLNSQHTIQVKSVGGAEMTAFIKNSEVGDRTGIKKKKKNPLHNPLYGAVNNILNERRANFVNYL